MNESIDMKQFEQFATSLKDALSLFKDQSTELADLKQTIHELEGKVIARAADATYGQKASFGFTDAHDAKQFLTFCKSVFTQDHATTKDLTEGVDSEGGYLVPTEWRATLIQMLESYGVARSKATVLPMSREELVMPKLTNGVQVYWIGEGKTIGETQPSFGELRMIAKKMAALVPMTSELLADTAIPIANLLLTLFAQAIAKEEDRVVFTGDVAGAGDPFNGVMFDPDAVNMAMASGATAFTDLTADFLADVIASTSPVRSSGAQWYMHRTVFNIIRKLQIQTYNGTGLAASGDYIYSAPNGTDPGTIWGYPYNLIESMPSVATTAVDTPFMFFGNMDHYYIADRQQLSIARSEHVGFAQDKIYLRVIQREAMAAAVPEAFTIIKTAAA